MAIFLLNVTKRVANKCIALVLEMVRVLESGFFSIYSAAHGKNDSCILIQT